MAPLAWILTTGAVGPLGLSSMQIAMCARARKMEPLSSSLLDRRGHPIGYCRSFGLLDSLAGYDRLLALAAPALAQASAPEIAAPPKLPSGDPWPNLRRMSRPSFPEDLPCKTQIAGRSPRSSRNASESCAHATT